MVDHHQQPVTSPWKRGMELTWWKQNCLLSGQHVSPGTIHSKSMLSLRGANKKFPALKLRARESEIETAGQVMHVLVRGSHGIHAKRDCGERMLFTPGPRDAHQHTGSPGKRARPSM